jgi:NAD(P)-dependent dehydrogenase (short-subunit alcohol dehydrogenase family)
VGPTLGADSLERSLDGRQVQIRLPKDAGAAGGIQSAIAQRLGAKGYTVALTADRGDKLTRSKPYQACAERGQIRLVRSSHPSWQVAAMLCDDFEEHDKHGQIVRVQGLDVSAVSTRNGWIEGFLDEHVRFGRDTVNKRSIKKDTVDAAVGGYELLTNTDEPQPLTVEQAASSAVGFNAIARTVHRGFALRSRGIS